MTVKPSRSNVCDCLRIIGTDTATPSGCEPSKTWGGTHVEYVIYSWAAFQVDVSSWVLISNRLPSLHLYVFIHSKLDEPSGSSLMHHRWGFLHELAPPLRPECWTYIQIRLQDIRQVGESDNRCIIHELERIYRVSATVSMITLFVQTSASHCIFTNLTKCANTTISDAKP